MVKGKSHFVLVHGACHGAWCWYKVATLLKSAGHKVTTLDMAGCGKDTKQVQDIGSLSEYHESLMTFMESLPSQEKVILVGHSFGGINISVAMERFPEKISVAVFVAALIVSENLTYPAVIQELLRRRREGELMDTQEFFLNGSHKPPTAILFGPKYMESKMYQLSPPEDLTLALSLVRPFPRYSDTELLLKDSIVTNDKYGRVPKIFIVSKEDNVLTEDAQMWMVETTAPFAELKMISNSDHMVMFSQPKQLCSLLLELGVSQFVLVHGSGHGAWCWYKVATVLKSAGHNVTTLDMAGCGKDTKQVQDIGSLSEYHEPLMTFMDSLPSQEKVILVGHSFGGINISVAMERFPEKISVAIFVAAFVVSENLTFPDIIQELEPVIKDTFMDTQHFFFKGPNNPPTAMSFGPKYMESKMYQLSPPEDLTLALSLVRPFPFFGDIELLLKDSTVTNEKNGRVPKIFIVCKGDNSLTEDLQMWMVERTGSFAE
ncbi:putative esterase PIR7A, partial [Mucuna pruriens]